MTPFLDVTLRDLPAHLAAVNEHVRELPSEAARFSAERLCEDIETMESLDNGDRLLAGACLGLEEREREKWIAHSAIAKEFEIDNWREYGIQHLFECSISRLHQRFWDRQDAIDAEWIEGPDGRWHQIDGWPEQGTARDDPAIAYRKWSRRAALWTAWQYRDLGHIVDWLWVAARESHDWIRNVDDRGRPKKLMKCGSVAALVREADKVSRRVNRSLDEQAQKLGPSDECVIIDLGAEHFLVRLMSPAALDLESSRMRHCIGHGSYDSKLKLPDFRFFSVRDPDGNPLATLEIRGEVLWQFRGLRNAEPTDAVKDLIAGVVDVFGWRKREARISPGEYQLDERFIEVLRGLPPARRRPG